jgi:hypothetical protein
LFSNMFVARLCTYDAPPVLTLSALNNLTHCQNTSVPVAFTRSGTFAANETIAVQLSTAGGAYVTVASGSQSPVNASIPVSTHQVRVVSSPSGLISNVVAIVNGLAPIAIMSPGSACLNTPISLQANGNPAYAYTWNIASIGTRTGSQTTVSFPTADTHTITLTATYQGCSVTQSGLLTVHPLSTATLTKLKDLSCGSATDGSIQAVFAGVNYGYYDLYRNGLIYASFISASSGTYTRQSLPAGQYHVLLYDNSTNCQTISNTVTIGDGSPQVSLCTTQLSCGSAAPAQVYFNLSYPQPPTNFGNRYQYRILKNGVEVIPL